MLSRSSRKIGSWLGLLAILMATLAPTISQTLAARGAHDDASPLVRLSMMPMPSMDHMSMDHMSMDDMPSMDNADTDTDTSTAPAATTPESPHKHAQMSDGDACGYCSLLAHLPAMPFVEASFVVAVRAREHVVATRFESVRRVAAPSFAQPRAPPVES